MPAFETLAAALDGSKGDFGIYSNIMLHRKHAGIQLQKPIEGLFGTNLTGIQLKFDNTTEANFRRVIFLSQLAQTLCIKTYSEALRRGEETFGSIIWQLNDVWQASSWGSLDYGGRWRALHHELQNLFAPSVTSVWVDGANKLVHIYGSHHGFVADLPAGGGNALLVEINITDIATGVVVQTHTVDWTPMLTASVDHLFDLQLDQIATRRSVIMTRFISTNSGLPVPVSETIHLLQPPAAMFWALTSKADMKVAVDRVSTKSTTAATANAAATSVSISLTNTNGAVPMFYVLATSTLAGRFSRNLLYIPAGGGSTTIEFFFIDGVTSSKEEVLESLSIDWLNKA